MIIVPPELYVPPADLAGLERYMAGKSGDWHVYDADLSAQKYVLMSDKPATADNHHVSVTVYLDIEPLFDMNQADESESNGNRFGDGKVIFRMPLAVGYSKDGGYLLRRMAEGDKVGARRVIRDSDMRKFKTFWKGP